MAKVLGAGGSTNLTGSKFGATLDLLRILSSNIFKADTMLKVHDESDIEFKADLIEAIDAVRKLVAPIDSKAPTKLASTSLRPHAGSASVVSVFRQTTLESMKELQGKILVVQEAVRLKHKDTAQKLQGWIQLLREANRILEASIVTYEKSHMQVKMHYSLNLNIIEAKITNVEGGLPNPYVEVWVDYSRRSRTRSLLVDDTPVWNQTFDVMIPSDAEEVTFKLFSESKDGLSDPAFLGKAELSIGVLKNQSLFSRWIPILCRGIGYVTEASSLHAIIKYKAGATPQEGSLTVIVVEARKLVEDGADLPSAYCRMSVIDQGSRKDLQSFLDGSESNSAGHKKDKKDKAPKDKTQKTSVVKKNDNPHWEEGFIFRFRWDTALSTKLLLEVHDDRQKAPFMGCAVIPLNSITSDPTKDAEIDRWFKLKRKGPKGERDDSISSSSSSTPNSSASSLSSSTGIPGLPQIGQLKLDIQYREERLLPDSFYDSLFELFAEDHIFLINFAAKHAGSPTAKRDIIKSLVGAFEMKNRGAWLLKSVSKAEVEETWDLNVLFRGNSIATACLDSFMRTVGRQVLDSTLRPILREMYKSIKSCELDPSRAPKGTDTKKNLAFFVEMLDWVWGSILSTTDKIPTTMRRVLSYLRSRVTAKWPNDSNSKYTSVTSFLFLRFFCPALMSPQSFDLVDEMPSAQVGRNLALLSKTIMNLANFIQYGTKEPNMSLLNDWLTSNFTKMRDYIDKLVEDPEASDTPIIHNANATLFIYGREMNNIREFLTLRIEKMKSEQESAIQTLRVLKAEPADVASRSSHAPVDKHHCSDDEDDVDDPTASRSGARRLFRRISSKSRLANGSRQNLSLSIAKADSHNPNVIQHYVDHLDHAMKVLDALNSAVATYQPSIVSPKTQQQHHHHQQQQQQMGNTSLALSFSPVVGLASADMRKRGASLSQRK